jgi:tetratricopeptide (TPR) repeat protein
MAVGGWDVFVSYGHEDAGWVRVLAGNLHRAGFDVFFDEWELVGGDRFAGRLEEGIRGSASGVLVVSPHALSRPWVREEYEALLRQAVQQPGLRRLVPVLYADAELPVFLGNRLWVDFRGAGTTGPQYEARLGELVRYLQGRPAADRPSRDGAVRWPAGPGGEVVRPAGPLRAELIVSAAGVSLAAGGDRVSQVPRGLRRSTADAVRELEWRRAHPDPDPDSAGLGAGDARLGEAGRRLAEDFLAGPVGAALAARVAQAAGLNEVLELGLEVAGPGLTDLPWEALQVPEPSGEVAEVGGSPLVLHRNVAVYRLITGLGTAPAHKVRGPLRLLVAIASPETAEAELLDYEAELARIVAAVEPARKRGEAYVRVLNEGSLKAIYAALSQDPEGFHVLHLSCHARPGELLLETPDGQPDPVIAERLLAEGVPAGADLPMVVLSGCSTGLAARQDRLHPGTAQAGPDGHRLKQDNGEGEAVLAGFAAQLVGAGVPQVLAMQAPVTDAYATALAGEFYRHLATDASPDPLLALAGARRAAERERQALPPGSPLRGPAEWATPALAARALRLPLFNRREPFGEVRPPQAPVLAEGVVVREVGDFVGRRGEMRQARRALGGAGAGLVLHGIGGVGKSTLAAEVLRSLGGDAGLVVSRAGQVSVDDVLGETGARLHLAASAAEGGEALARAALMLRAADVEWADRWRLLAEQVLPAVPVTVLLDNFEDNLTEADDGSGWQVRDPELAAFLAGWARRPGQSKLVFTCRYPFALPGAAGRRLATLHLGPLSAAETRKLIWRLPGLDALPPADKDRAYRDVGGHPRTLEYLDALLRGGQARFDDVAVRMEDRLRGRGIADPAAWLARPGRDLDASLAEAVTLSVDDVVLSGLLDRLAATPLARELVTGASVYRVPVDDTALEFQADRPAERLPDPERTARIHRVQQAIDGAVERSGGGRISLEDAGLSDDDYARYQADLAEERRPPVDAPDGMPAAVAAARAAGLLVPVPAGDQAPLHFVHRWTARAIAALHPGAAQEAHRRAAGFWHWRVDTLPQSRQDDIDQLLEARHHHHAAGQADQAFTATQEAVTQLQTWGQYGRAAGLCRETLTWLTPDSREAAETAGTLGILAQLRGDYDSAERSYSQVLDIFTRLGDQAGMSTGYHQLGMLAQLRGDYDAAEPLYRQSLDINERLGNQAGMSTGYHQLGMLAQHRGDYDAAEPLYRQSLDINERLGNQAGMSTGYHQLGMLAQDRGDYDAAEPLYRQSLDIDERIGDQAGAATSYAVLGGLSEAVGNLDQAVAYRVHALALRLNIGTTAAGDVRALTGLRRQLGRDRFRSAALASGLDEQSATSLMEMLDQQEGPTAGN